MVIIEKSIEKSIDKSIDKSIAISIFNTIENTISTRQRKPSGLVQRQERGFPIVGMWSGARTGLVDHFRFTNAGRAIPVFFVHATIPYHRHREKPINTYVYL